MSDRRYLIAIVAALFTAMLATVGVYRMLDRAASGEDTPTRRVVIAASDIAEGTPLERASLHTVEWPVASVPDSAVSDAGTIVGRVARVRILRGAPVITSWIAGRGADIGLEGTIAPGKRAMAVRVNEAASASGLVRPGSHVDVVVTLRDETNGVRHIAKLVMSNVRVLSVGASAERAASGGIAGAAGPPIATLEVTPEQAEQLAVTDGQGTINLVLRAFGSTEAPTTRGATSRDVLGLSSAPAAGPAAAPAAAPPRATLSRAAARRPVAPRVVAAREPAPAPPQPAPPPKPVEPAVKQERPPQIQVFRGRSASRGGAGSTPSVSATSGQPPVVERTP